MGISGNMARITLIANRIGGLCEELSKAAGSALTASQLAQLTKSLDLPSMTETIEAIQPKEELLSRLSESSLQSNLGLIQQLAKGVNAPAETNLPPIQQSAANPLHSIRQIASAQDVSQANRFMEAGWMLLDIDFQENCYLFGWPHDSNPKWPPGHYCYDDTNDDVIDDKTTNTTNTTEITEDTETTED